MRTILLLGFFSLFISIACSKVNTPTSPDPPMIATSKVLVPAAEFKNVEPGTNWQAHCGAPADRRGILYGNVTYSPFTSSVEVLLIPQTNALSCHGGNVASPCAGELVRKIGIDGGINASIFVESGLYCIFARAIGPQSVSGTMSLSIEYEK